MMSVCIYLSIISKVIYLIIVPLLNIGDAEEGPCSGHSYGCCPHTKWDTENNMCKETRLKFSFKKECLCLKCSEEGDRRYEKDCPPGYFWINCSKACPYPFYGNVCNRSCQCNETDCDYKDGCRKVLTLLHVTFLRLVDSKSGPCIQYPKGCCPSTMWDTAKKQCVECPSGFYWFNCSKRCVYPYFGYKCKDNCFCKKDLCDFVRGCLGYIENSTRHSLSSCKTEIAKPDADKNSFVTVLTVIAVVCIACVMVFLFKEPRQHHSDQRMQPQIM